MSLQETRVPSDPQARTLTPARLFVAAALCALACGARADLIDIQWTEDGGFAQSRTIAPGKFVEVCGPLTPGQGIQWSFEADRAVDFNIHYHVGKDVRYPAKQDRVTALQGRLVADAPQDHCWMWVNKSAAAVRLALRLSKG